MKKKRKIDKVKVASAVLSLAIVGAIMFGIISVINNVKNNVNSKYDLLQHESEEETQEQTKEYVAYEEDLTEAPSVEPMTEAKIPEPVTEAPTVPLTPVISPTAAKAEFSFSENDVLAWPVNGELLLKYSMDSTIYYATLQQYKCNPSISIGAAVGTPVKAAAAGRVIKMYEDEETGLTLMMDIGGDYILTYGQLNQVTVKEGSVVMAGDVIGVVAEPSAYYKVEGANLYFAMEKGGKSVDPTLFLAE